MYDLFGWICRERAFHSFFQDLDLLYIDYSRRIREARGKKPSECKRAAQISLRIDSMNSTSTVEAEERAFRLACSLLPSSFKTICFSDSKFHKACQKIL
jgi:hypothetical protein